LLTRLSKKKEKQQNDIPEYKPDSKPTFDSSTTKPKQLTFEELLKEITESKQPEKPVYEAKKPAYQPTSQREVVDYDDSIGEEEQDLEEVDYDYRKKDKLYDDVYEDAKRQAFARASLEETMNVRDTDMKFGKFGVFEQKKQRNLLEEYTKSFQDPEGLKKAVVMSEILNRKF
jgi:hypothetical protein